MIIEYPKTQTLWKRDDTGKIIEGDYSLPEFELIKYWHVTEKIDGTNIRIILEHRRPAFEHESIDELEFRGRTDKAQLPAHLLKYLQETFTVEKMQSIRPDGLEVAPGSTIILFGEGYGKKIQGGQPYRKTDVSFVLFDVWIDGWWLEQSAVTEIASKLAIDRVPIIATTTLERNIIDYVKSLPASQLSQEPRIIEGVVARTSPLLLQRNGKPLMWKLKVIDFDK